MRIARTFAFILMLVLLSCSQQACRRQKMQEIVITPDIEKTHLQRNHIFGQVKEIWQTVYVLDTLANEAQEVSRSVQHYSADGYLTSVVTLSRTGDTLMVRQVTYDGDARELKWEERDPSGKLLESCVYEYDINHFKVGEKHYRNDTLLLHISYKTDGKGNAIEINQQFDSYSLRNTVQYDEHGLVTRIDEFEPNGKPFKYITIEYDNYGDEVNRRVFKSGGDLIEYTFKEYDNEGRLLKKIFEDRRHDMQEVYIYSQHDAHGNWTCEEITKLGNIAFQRIREIIYY